MGHSGVGPSRPTVLLIRTSPPTFSSQQHQTFDQRTPPSKVRSENRNTLEKFLGNWGGEGTRPECDIVPQSYSTYNKTVL